MTPTDYEDWEPFPSLGIGSEISTIFAPSEFWIRPSPAATAADGC